MKLLSDEKKAALQAVPSPGLPALPSNPFPWPPSYPFLRFSYTSQQLQAEGGKPRMTGQQVCYENGRLSAERFEGELPISAYYQAVDDAQRMFADQTLTIVEQCSALLSALLLQPGRRD